jgi:hypothetical protein
VVHQRLWRGVELRAEVRRQHVMKILRSKKNGATSRRDVEKTNLVNPGWAGAITP